MKSMCAESRPSGEWLLEALPFGAGLTFRQRIVKRSFDVVCSLFALLALSPLLLLLAAAVRLTSRGPAFFRQKRVGRHGRLFTVYKLRTMRVGSEAGSSVTTARDNRITRCGRFLRRFRLDEWPQLWNILKGDMSFVGPRPDVPGYADVLRGDARRILEIRPGLTGPATLFFRDEEGLLALQADPVVYNDTVIYPMKVRLNRQYLDSWSLLRDLGYILITAIPALNRRWGLVPGREQPQASDVPAPKALRQLFWRNPIRLG